RVAGAAPGLLAAEEHVPVLLRIRQDRDLVPVALEEQALEPVLDRVAPLGLAARQVLAGRVHFMDQIEEVAHPGAGMAGEARLRGRPGRFLARARFSHSSTSC